MHNNYIDITDRIVESPSWWDVNGTPRYGEFSPASLPDIYADEAVLYKIQCQNCNHFFNVSESLSYLDKMKTIMTHRYITDKEKFDMKSKEIFSRSLSDSIKDKTLHYGDPPNNGCCNSGATMNCNDIKVLQYWKKKNHEWKRFPEFELLLCDADKES